LTRISFLERTLKFAAEGATDFDEPLPKQEKYRGFGVGPGGIPQGAMENGIAVFARYRNDSSFSFSRRLSSVTPARIARRLQPIGNQNAKPPGSGIPSSPSADRCRWHGDLVEPVLGKVVEAAGVERFRVLTARKLLILGTATMTKKAPFPDPLYVYCTKIISVWSRTDTKQSPQCP